MNITHRLFELQMNDVINITDGRNIGRISDVEFDGVTGGILNMVIPGKTKYFGLFGRSEDICIPWQKIRLIGVDSILIEYPELLINGERITKENIWDKIFD